MGLKSLKLNTLFISIPSLQINPFYNKLGGIGYKNWVKTE